MAKPRHSRWISATALTRFQLKLETEGHQVTGTAIDRLNDEFTGELVRASHPQYDSLRRIFNGMINRRPAVIARCTSSADVSAAVKHGREQGMPISVHGGGHGVSG